MPYDLAYMWNLNLRIQTKTQTNKCIETEKGWWLPEVWAVGQLDTRVKEMRSTNFQL